MEELRQYQREKYCSLVRELTENIDNIFLSKSRQIPEKKMSTPEQQSSSLNYSQSTEFQHLSNKNRKALKKFYFLICLFSLSRAYSGKILRRAENILK
jgi:hypothetical protein